MNNQKAQHTPGPWEATSIQYPNKIVWGVRNSEWAEPNPYPSDPHLGISWETENEADARLIAAAPELLRAAKLAFKNFPKPDSPGLLRVAMELEKAIAKAEGRGE